MKMKSWLRNKLSRYLNWSWDFGIIEKSLDDIIEGRPFNIRYTNLKPKNRWFADPFILDYDNDKLSVLCEEMSSEHKKGRIAYLEFDRISLQLLEWKIIYQVNTHLSFPCIERDENDLFVHPENAHSGNHTIYRYDTVEKKLNSPKVICRDAVVDAVMLQYENIDWLFATKNNNTTLYAYVLQGNEYVLKETIDFHNFDARRAGCFFYHKGHLYSPAQDCSKTYGGAVIIQEVIRQDGRWHFIPIRTLKSTHPSKNFGMHTFNVFKDLVIVDVKGFEHPNLVRFIKRMQSLLQLKK